MKQLFLMVALMLTISISNAQNKLGALYDSTKATIENASSSVKTAVSDSYTTIDTSSNIRAFGNEVKSAISTLASSLKVGAEHVYSVLVRKYFIEGVSYLLIGIIVSILLYNISKKVSRWYDKQEDKSNADSFMPPGILWLLIIGLVIFMLSCLPDTLNKIINPEWDAINFIISKIK